LAALPLAPDVEQGFGGAAEQLAGFEVVVLRGFQKVVGDFGDGKRLFERCHAPPRHPRAGEPALAPTRAATEPLFIAGVRDRI